MEENTGNQEEGRTGNVGKAAQRGGQTEEGVNQANAREPGGSFADEELAGTRNEEDGPSPAKPVQAEETNE